MKTLLSLLLMTCALGFSADLTGRWTGTILVADPGSGTTITTQVQVEITQQAQAVSGKIGRVQDREMVPIRNARLEGDTLYFEASSEETAGTMKFTLKVDGDQMEGAMKGAIDSEDINGKVKLTREKSAARR